MGFLRLYKIKKGYKMLDASSKKATITWAKATLASRAYHLLDDAPTVIQETPYSYVIAFKTTQGLVYLKHTPEKLALESQIITCLKQELDAFVPVLINQSLALHCFLMKDAGLSLREVLRSDFKVSIIVSAFSEFSSLQYSAVTHVDRLLSLGVPDFRLEKMTDLYMALLLEKALLLEDGLSMQEIADLKSLKLTVAQWCEKLSEYGVKQTLVQPDCNDNNILIDPVSGVITVIDMGEIVISHPLFSLLNFLYVIKRQYSLTESNHDYLHIKSACLDQCLKGLTKADVLDAVDLAEKLRPIYWALSGYRLIDACDKEQIMALQRGKLSATLRLLL
jgi:hypothetical protein